MEHDIFANVGQAVHVGSDFIEVGQIKLTEEEPFLIGALADDITPGVNNHGVTEAQSMLVVGSSELGRCDHICLVFNSTSS